jgi:F0F1-type ATP synthase membrane subunit b/b'
MKKITGTDSQIKWAEDIRKKLRKDAERMIADYADSTTNIAKKRIARCEAVLERIETQEDAKWYIKYSNTPAHGVGKDLIGK